MVYIIIGIVILMIIVCACADSTSDPDRSFDTYYHEECHKARKRYEQRKEEEEKLWR